MNHHFEQGPKSFRFVLVVVFAIGFSYAYYCRQNEIPLEPFDQQIESIDGMTYEGSEVQRVGPGAIGLCTQASALRSVRINEQP